MKAISCPFICQVLIRSRVYFRFRMWSYDVLNEICEPEKIMKICKAFSNIICLIHSLSFIYYVLCKNLIIYYYLLLAKSGRLFPTFDFTLVILAIQLDSSVRLSTDRFFGILDILSYIFRAMEDLDLWNFKFLFII